MQDVYFKPHSNDGTLDGTAFERWNEMIVEGAKKLNRDWHCVKHYKRWFEEVGFEDVADESLGEGQENEDNRPVEYAECT